jgi:FtsH-binding integral membrane protein
MSKIIKITLVLLFFLCLADMPYGYYQLVRFVALVGFAILAFQANEQKNQTETVIYVALALLFQPFFKVALGRTIWNVVDIVVGIGLLVSLYVSKNSKETK